MQNETSPLQKNWLEWLVFAASLLLVTGVFGYLVFTSATLGHSPPMIKIELGKSESEGEYFRVPVKIRNTGDQTVEGVQIEVILNEGEPGEETASFEAAFLPRHSQREGAVTFKTDPRAGNLKTRVLGYENP